LTLRLSCASFGRSASTSRVVASAEVVAKNEPAKKGMWIFEVSLNSCPSFLDLAVENQTILDSFVSS
jgi:hypothetical protein